MNAFCGIPMIMLMSIAKEEGNIHPSDISAQSSCCLDMANK